MLTDVSLSTSDYMKTTLTIALCSCYGGQELWSWLPSAQGLSQLVVCQGNFYIKRYIDQMLRLVVVRMFRKRQDLVLQLYKARSHLHVLLKTLYRPATLTFCLFWYVYRTAILRTRRDYLGPQLRKRKPQPGNVQQLTVALHQELGWIPQYLLRNMCGSMGERITAVVASRDDHTSYWFCQWNCSDQSV